MHTDLKHQMEIDIHTDIHGRLQPVLQSIFFE